nr:reverse transcriptase domain-containing protein [Tanacetum cinerariifolium]
MADNRTMEELLQEPTEGYGEAIVISKINADHFEIKKNLLQLVQANQYHGFERENPHTHVNNFKSDSHAHTFLEHNSMHQSRESSVVAAATVRIPGFSAVLAVLKPEHLKVDKARIE